MLSDCVQFRFNFSLIENNEPHNDGSSTNVEATGNNGYQRKRKNENSGNNFSKTRNFW